MAPWRLRDATMAVAGPELTVGSFPTPATCPSGVPGRIVGMAGIAGRALEWGRIIVMVPPEGIDQNARGIFLRAFFCYSLQQYPFPLTIVHFLARTRKRNQKKAPVSRFLLRVDGVAGARGNSPAFGGLRQSARLFPSTPSMLGAGQWERAQHHCSTLSWCFTEALLASFGATMRRPRDNGDKT